MRKKLKIVVVLISAILIGTLFGINVSAYEPYINYTFTPDRERVVEPQAVSPQKVVTGNDIGVGEFNGITDVHIRNDKFYIVDSGNNRVIVTDLNFKLFKEISFFENSGVTDTFNSPQGIYVDEYENIYICDTNNNRIVVLDNQQNMVKIVVKPNSEVFEDNYVFLPQGVAVDNAGRIFVVAENVNQGILEFNKKCEFQNFFGPIEVKANAWQAFLKIFATDAQKSQMTVTVPTEYSGIDIDDSGFVYGTVSIFEKENFNETIFIHKLNPIGNDVLKRNGYAPPMGDVDYKQNSDSEEYDVSRLIDIKTYEEEFYSVLDEENGRVFTYNKDGFLLYVFGALGNNLGQFLSPTALEVNGNNYYISDYEMNHIAVFALTDYGYNIKQAVIAEGKLEYEQADEYWDKVMLHTAKSHFTYNRIGTSALKNGDYHEALKYLESAEDKDNYSLAFKYIRDSFMSDKFDVIVIACILLVGIIIVIKILLNKRKKQR